VTDGAGRGDFRGDQPAYVDCGADLVLASPAVLWRPRFVALSPELGHVPFLFWLLEATKPQQIVQIGLGDWVGFLALCQGVDKLDLSTLCTGIDLGHSPLEMSTETREAQVSRYKDFVTVLEPDVATAPHTVAGDRVDLLVINAPLTDDFVSTLEAEWMPRLSEHGVAVVFNDPKTLRGQAGIWLARLKDACAFLEFRHVTPGIDVLLVGRGQTGRLRTLAENAPGKQGFLGTRQLFEGLGLGMHSQYETLTRMTAAHAERLTDIAVLTIAHDKAVEAREADHKAAIADLEARIDTMRAAESRALALLEDFEAKARSLDQTRHLLEQQLADRIEDIAVLSAAHLEEAESAAKANSEMIDRLRKELEKAKSQHDEKTKALVAEKTDLEKRIEALMNSTSWRVTAPIRKLRQIVAKPQ